MMGHLVELLRRGGLRAASTDIAAAGAADVLVTYRESLRESRSDEVGTRQDVSSCPSVSVVARATRADARRLLREGVAGLVLESEVERTLIPTVRAVSAGQIAYPVALLANGVVQALSNREKQILGMVVMGFSNAEISAKLFISESTVKSHLSSSFSKLGVSSRTEATERILDPVNGLGTGILAISDRAADGDSAVKSS
jgi:DNA-binding NarL/FixJ family response regulator